MIINIKVTPITHTPAHATTLYEVYDRDMTVIHTYESTAETKNEYNAEISDMYSGQTLYIKTVYKLIDGTEVADGLNVLNNKNENILDFYPPKIVCEVKDDLLLIRELPSKKYLSNSTGTPKVNIVLKNTAMHEIIRTIEFNNSFSISLRDIPTFIHLLEVEAVYVLDGKAVSNFSRETVKIKHNDLEISNLEYNIDDMYTFSIGIGELQYVDKLKEEPLAYAMIRHSEGVLPLVPRIDDALSFKIKIDKVLVDPVLGIHVMVGGTLKWEEFQLKNV